MTTTWTVRTIAAVATLAFAGTALADAASFQKSREDYFHAIGKAAKASNEEFKKPAPSIAEIQKLAAAIDALAPKEPSMFPAGSGPETGLKTEARAEIWTKWSDFKAAADKFAGAAHNYSLVAQKGDVAAAKAAFYQMGGTCKACHEQFRKEDH